MIHHHYLLCLGTTLECLFTDILGENALNEKGTKKHARAKHNGLMLLLAAIVNKIYFVLNDCELSCR